MFAPNGMGNQHVVIVVVQDKELIQRLSRMNVKIMGNSDIDPFYGAPTIIIVLAVGRIHSCFQMMYTS
nr:hypothetical protein [Clostridium thailandense]